MSSLFAAGVYIDMLVLDTHVEHFVQYNYGNKSEQGLIKTLQEFFQGNQIKPHIISTAIEQYALFCDKTLRQGYHLCLEKQHNKEDRERRAAFFDTLKKDMPNKRKFIPHYIPLTPTAVDRLKHSKHDYNARHTMEAINKALNYLKEMQSLFFECYQPYLFNPMTRNRIRLRKEHFLL